MKRKLSIFLLAAMLLTLTACSSGEKRPPVRVGEATGSASLARSYSFEEAFQEAEAVVLVRVGSWLGEKLGGFPLSFYEATVLESYKGSVPSSFTLVQNGASSGTYEDYPLYTCGNELLLFLRGASGDWSDDYPAAYQNIGSFSTMLYAADADDGTRYYLDRFGLMSMAEQTAPDSTLTVEPASRALSETTVEELRDSVKKTDSLLAEELLTEGEFTTYAYTEAALETLFASLTNG